MSMHPHRHPFRLSLRTLLILVAGLSVGLGVWTRSKSRAFVDVQTHVAANGLVVSPSALPTFPFVVPVVTGASFSPQSIGYTGLYRRQYYFWMFGLIVKLPYESDAASL